MHCTAEGPENSDSVSEKDVRRSVCVCLLLVRARAKIKGNKYGATRSAGDYRRTVQLARLEGERERWKDV